MKKEYCNLCWAKLPNGSCFCSNKERRQIECVKARKRLARKKEDERPAKKELHGLREYFSYIPVRLAYLKESGNISSNEWNFYVELYSAIKEWGKAHEIFFKYLIKKIDFDRLVRLYGLSERQCVRINGTIKKNLVDYIQKQEELLREKYPFEPCEGWGEAEESNERTS